MTTAFILSTTGIGVDVGVNVGRLVSVGMGLLVSVGGGSVSVETDVAVTESTCPVDEKAKVLQDVNKKMNNVKTSFVFIV